MKPRYDPSLNDNNAPKDFKALLMKIRELKGFKVDRCQLRRVCCSAFYKDYSPDRDL